MSALEAVARAIAKCGGTEWDCDPKDPADVYMHMARAALAALRDNGVTEGMLDAWVNVPVIWPDEPDNGRTECEAEFRAMLDAALYEN